MNIKISFLFIIILFSDTVVKAQFHVLPIGDNINLITDKGVRNLFTHLQLFSINDDFGVNNPLIAWIYKRNHEVVVAFVSDDGNLFNISYNYLNLYDGRKRRIIEKTIIPPDEYNLISQSIFQIKQGFYKESVEYSTLNESIAVLKMHKGKVSSGYFGLNINPLLVREYSDIKNMHPEDKYIFSIYNMAKFFYEKQDLN